MWEVRIRISSKPCCDAYQLTRVGLVKLSYLWAVQMINISSTFIYPIKKTFPDAKVKTKHMYKCYFLILIMDPVFRVPFIKYILHFKTTLTVSLHLKLKRKVMSACLTSLVVKYIIKLYSLHWLTRIGFSSDILKVWQFQNIFMLPLSYFFLIFSCDSYFVFS